MSSVTSNSNGNNNDNSKAPQELISEFWENLITKNPGKVTRIFPSSLYTNLLPPRRKSGVVKGKNAAESYEAAAKECRARVERIVRECKRTNEKFTDPDFDIEERPRNCLDGLMRWYEYAKPASPTATVSSADLGYALRILTQAEVLHQDVLSLSLNNTANVLLNSQIDLSDEEPGATHRIDWIFENPKFEIEGFSSSDVVQGANGDCWFIAAVATICSNQGLIRRVCVTRDEQCGVYGFVFYRDGEWIWTVVDDNLFLTKSDFDAQGDTYDPAGTKEMRYKKNHQTGSEALYFASCAHENETWLPLLEKAYAKVHGDYDAISGGISGEAVEDLTGGVTSKILTARILDKNHLWEELKQVNKDFLFSASSPGGYGDDSTARRGLALNHAYSIIDAVDVASEDEQTKYRLVLIRNPWGKRANAAMGEWTGPWSDGSSEWTPYWMEKLKHKFGDDGLFWMSYEDLLKRFDLLDRTRLFDSAWTVVQNWTSVSVAWVTGYLNTKFSIEIKKKGPTVFQLCQLDERYFRGLVGKYTFNLHFMLQEKDSEAGDYIVRARSAWFGNRSISAEVELEPGVYEVLPKIEAKRNPDALDVFEVVTKVAERNPQKLRQIGLNYDVANAKGVVELTDEEMKQQEKKKKEAAEKKQRDKEEADKEKAEYEAWKKGEKEEYQAWKKEKKLLEEKTKAENDQVQTDKPKPAELEKEEGHFMSSATDREGEHHKPVAGSKDGTQIEDTTLRVEEAKPTDTVAAAQLTTKKAKHNLENANSPSDDDNAEHTPDEGPELHSRASSRPVSRGRRSPLYMYQHHPRNVYGDEPPRQSGSPARSPVDSRSNSWNAVCVLGLRVYSQDPEVTIKLVKPKNVEEGAILDIDGDTAAGATM